MYSTIVLSMQFQVPQFIEVEDKIFGPLTLKQFIYLAGGVGISVALYFLIPVKILAIVLGAPFLALALALAFYRVNGKAFVDVMEAAISFWLKNKLYIWKKTPKNPAEQKKKAEEASLEPLLSPRLSDSRLKELAWSLDVNEQVDKQKFRQFTSEKREGKDDVQFKKNYDLGVKSHL